MKLRDYQTKAVDAVFEKWNDCRSVLGVAATGSGKTQIAAEIIRRTLPGRSLVLVHRQELVTQAVDRLRSFDVECDIEKADLVASTSYWHRSPCVVATVQTLISGGNGYKRVHRFKPQDFNMLWVDEAHHLTAPSWLSTIKYFLDGNPNLKLFACTATPDRADNESLAKVIESVAFNIEITELIERGFLVDIDQRMVKIKSLDFSNCRTTAGDLNGRDLAEVMEVENNLHGIADATLSIAAGKRTLVFAASVKQAERCAEIFNRHQSGLADCVFGHTPKDKRSELFKRFTSGDLKILVNVGVATEGVDVPGIEAIVMGRPTKSRALYCQMLGRGTRPLTGVVESVLLDDDQARRNAIRESAKPSLLVLDFVGNSGRHKLITSVDVLGGKISEEARELAEKRIRQKGAGNVRDELAIAENEIKKRTESARRLGLVGTAIFTATYVDPFAAFTRRAEKWRGFQQHRRLSEKQRRILCKNGYNPDDRDLSENLAIFKRLIGLSDKQRSVMLRSGYKPEEVDGMTKWEASACITELANNNWRRPAPKTPAATSTLPHGSTSVPPNEW